MTAAIPVGSSAVQSIGVPFIPLLINRSVMSLAALSVSCFCVDLMPALICVFTLAKSAAGILEVILAIFAAVSSSPETTLRSPLPTSSQQLRNPSKRSQECANISHIPALWKLGDAVAIQPAVPPKFRSLTAFFIATALMSFAIVRFAKLRTQMLSY